MNAFVYKCYNENIGYSEVLILKDKTFELLEKIYIEIQDMKQNIKGIEENMATKHDIVRLENKMDSNHKSLYGGYKLTYEKLAMLDDKVNELDKKVEKQDVRELHPVCLISFN